MWQETARVGEINIGKETFKNEIHVSSGLEFYC